MFSFMYTKKNKTQKNKTQKFKKINCSPVFAGKKASAKTCYNKNILLTIRDAYNKSPVNANKINSNNPTKVWEKLRENLVDCKVESCWLREIKDKQLANNIKKYVFAPKQPPEWESNPNEWLSNFDLLDVMSQYESKYPEFEFIGPSCIDFDTKIVENGGKCVEQQLCNFSLVEQIKNKKRKIAVIFNLDKHTQSGSHWVSLFVDIDNEFIFFFDSAGNKIPSEIQILVDRIIQQGNKIDKPIKFNFYQNYPKEHQQGNTECGMYSLFLIITFLTGHIDSRKCKDYKSIIKYFKTKRIPDKYVEKYRDIYFNDTV